VTKILILAVGTGLLGACAAKFEEPPSPETVRLAQEAGQKTSGFAFRLFAQLLRERTSENLFVSPASVSFALAMAQTGARGATEGEMARVLGWEGLAREEVDRRQEALRKVLRSAEPRVRLEIAQSAWVRNDFPLRPEYIQVLRERYSAGAQALDFQGPQAPEAINRWVSDHTAGKIPALIEGPLDPALLLVLVNAVYFKGEWREKFEPEQTRKGKFHAESGATPIVSFMNRTGQYGYLEKPDFEAVRIPYGKTGRMALYVFLPREASRLADFEAKLSGEAFRTWVKEFGEGELTLSLPKFKLESNVSLRPALEALGMVQAFRDHADFSGITERGPNLMISRVVQKAMIDVNEEGTEAAAATHVGLMPTAAPSRPFVFRADRPFFMSLRDDGMETLLFMGSIRNLKE